MSTKASGYHETKIPYNAWKGAAQNFFQKLNYPITLPHKEDLQFLNVAFPEIDI